MVEIRLFGGVDVRADGAPIAEGLLAQPRPTALLALLAIEGNEAYLRRDRLASLFWPESGQDHARANLRKLLLTIRRAVGNEILEARGDEEVRLNGDRVWCDAAEFANCLRQGEFDRAMELYRGPLLAGFTLEGAFAFQEWLDTTRSYFAREAVKLALRSAESLVRANERTRAADIAQFTLRIEPELEDEHQLRKLISLLDQMGDRIGAVRLYERFTQRLWQNYRVAPARETRELMERVRNS